MKLDSRRTVIFSLFLWFSLTHQSVFALVEPAITEEAPLSSDDFEMINNNEVPADSGDNDGKKLHSHANLINNTPFIF